MTPPKRRGTRPEGPDSRYYHDGRYYPPARVLRPSRPRWSWLAWPTVLVGVALLAVGWIGAKTGAVAIPGDRHHVLSQLIGLGLLFLGVRIGGRRTDR